MDREQVKEMQRAIDRLTRAGEALIGYTDGFYRGPSVKVAKEFEHALNSCKRYLLKSQGGKEEKGGRNV